MAGVGLLNRIYSQRPDGVDRQIGELRLSCHRYCPFLSGSPKRSSLAVRHKRGIAETQFSHGQACSVTESFAPLLLAGNDM